MINLNKLAFCGAGIILFGANMHAAEAATSDDEVAAILACRSITEDALRLACMDEAADMLANAQSTGEIIVLQKDRVEQVEREMFGFQAEPDVLLEKLRPVPSTPPAVAETATAQLEKPKRRGWFSRDRQPKPEKEQASQTGPTKRVTLELDRMEKFGYGKVRYFFKNGQVWEQIDSDKVRIRKSKDGSILQADIFRASLGSYMLKLGAESAVRVKRIR